MTTVLVERWPKGKKASPCCSAGAYESASPQKKDLKGIYKETCKRIKLAFICVN